MLKISILKVENPSSLWGRVVRGPGCDAETTEHYSNLLAQMNLFYHDVTQDLRKLKHISLEEGQVCVVYWAVMKSWCRAVVESIIMDSISCQARCLLVDHGERIVVPSDKVRVAVPNFLQLPFWVRKFHLAGIKPTTLRVSVYEEKAELIPSSHWDSSATLYLHNLLQASTRTEAILLESESGSTSIQLYLTVSSIKICVNDDMVAKKFAYYSGTFADSGGLDAGDRSPVMLSSNILTQTSPNKLTAQPQQPPVTSESFHSAGAGDWLMAHPLPQSQLHVASEGDRSSEVSKVQTSSSNDSRNDSEAAAAESDSSEDTDSSLAAALTENLDMFRFLKFMNPGSGCQEAVSIMGQSDELHDCESKERTVMSTARTEQELDPVNLSSNTQLLEWLNPEPLNSDPDTCNNVVSPSDPRMNGILVHSALQVEPCNSMEDAPITDALRWVLQRKQYCALSPADSYSWPAVARGCNTVIISHITDQPLSYLAPLLTHILLNSIFTSLTSSSGPVAVVLCPGWERAQVVYNLLEESKVAKTLHPVIVILGIGKDEAKAVKIPKNCLLLVTTPFTLARLLSCHCFLFLRLYHLVLDEADKLFTVAPDQMATILKHFQRVTSSEEKCPKQLVALAKRWTSHMEDLITNHMPYPCVVITVPEEAALYGNVQQATLMTLESNKISALLDVLDFSPDIGQKTLIVANCVQEVEDVYNAVRNKSAFCLMTHERSTHQFDFVIQQWRKNIGPCTHVILVTTNECLRCLGIRDATCVVHYGFPTSPKLFGSRLFCMAENFRNLSERVSPNRQFTDQTESCSLITRSVLLISERNARHVFGVLRYLGRTNAVLPPELLLFAQGVHVAREHQKINRPLCSYLKSFGFCRDISTCPDRHRFNSQLDQSLLPASGIIEVIPVYIKTASVFYGRMVRKQDRGFDEMTSEMATYYADKKPGAKELHEGGLYAVQEDELFYRVKILSLPNSSDSLFVSIFVQFIDVGKEEEVKSHQILHLPEQFHSLPGQAIEIIVCRVKPVDVEIDWHPKVSRAISLKIRGLQHRARAVFSLGNTVFVDPMVRVTQLPGMKTVINEYNVQSEILNTGMGVSNPKHLDLLRALCQDDLASSGKDAGHASRGDGSSPLEVSIKAEEEVLAPAFRVGEVRSVAALDPPQLKPHETFTMLASTNQSLVQASPRPEVHQVSICDQHSPLESQSDSNPTGQMERFHPHVRWHQTSDSVIVKVKLTNPENQHCDFYPDRVVYSGRVDGRSYRADLELHQNILAEVCCWEIMSNEPVLKLVKQQQGYWERLVRTKNIFVSYDMEHIDEDVENASNGPCFVENTGEENWYVNSESGSESD
ncbi:putative ATP-dependent RNA helicase TDRD12 [Leuresthes tenuis]|uniref:putative ATP-dependent RNA helicase TDRD12 n=1 Tax=Leuresthes tenuis TaxID=355514 RepID=UPI003B502EC2